VDGEGLAAGERVDPGLGQGGVDGVAGGDIAQGAAQHLAAVREGRVDDLEDPLPRHRRRGWIAVRPGDQAGVDVGRRPEHVASDGAGPAYVGVPGRLDRRHAVHLGAGGRGQPVGYLGLHHHQPVPQRGQQRHQVEEHRDGDVVGQVGNQGGRRRPGHRLDPQRVRQHDLEVVCLLGGVRRDRLGQQLRELVVELDRHHPAGHLEQGQRQRPETRTDLQDDVVGTDTGLPHDPPDRVGIDHEVLTALLGRAQVEPRGQRADLRRAQQARNGGGVGHGRQRSQRRGGS